MAGAVHLYLQLTTNQGKVPFSKAQQHQVHTSIERASQHFTQRFMVLRHANTNTKTLLGVKFTLDDFALRFIKKTLLLAEQNNNNPCEETIIFSHKNNIKSKHAQSS